MKTYTQEELQSILDLHRNWLYDESGGVCADLSYANLDGANLRGANLGYANLDGANLRGANLGYANLRGANLRGANLDGANLDGANLRGANLDGANLRGANLGYANLRGANLRGANLDGANLDGANLDGANLGGAKSADLAMAKTLIVPQEGSFTAWKAADIRSEYGMLVGHCIVKLRIPEDAARSNATGRKCRASKAEVLAVEPLGAIEMKEGYTVASKHDRGFTYEVGATVEPTRPFCEDRWQECAPGIHFFITREEAEAWA